MILTASILVPLAGALLFALRPRWSSAACRALGSFIAAVPLVLLVIAWARFDPNGPLFQHITDVPWIPALGVGYRLGVDGIALPIATASALLYVIAIAYPIDYRDKPASYVGWMLFLEAVSLGLFVALDLLIFYVCFDLSLVGMYFLVAIWGHEDRERAALKFFLYTLAGSLVMLLGILSLVLAADPISFDMRVLIAEQPLEGAGARANVTAVAILFGLAVKAPLVPFHTWLPPAHVEAPAPASAILAGVLLKMGTYGMIRLPFSMLREAFSRLALILAVIAAIGIVYSALVALGQRHLKRRIAYTSITHMGYTVLGLAAASLAAGTGGPAARIALSGATLEMVAHALVIGALFLLSGSLWQRGHSFDMDAYGGLASPAPKLTAAMVIASFAALGLPGLAPFVAEFQIFSGALAVQPWLAGAALLGVLITAALFLQLLQVSFFGITSERSARITDLDPVEATCLGLLLALTVLIGIAPAFILDLIDGAAASLVAPQ